MRLTILGSGTSFGVPQIGCECAVCRSPDPRDRRTRTSALVQTGATSPGGGGGTGGGTRATILIDTPPEIRLQLVAAGVKGVDAVLYTHEHADHVNGIDDLRMFSLRHRIPLPLYGPPSALEYLRTGFRYIFDDDTPIVPGTSKPRLSLHELRPGEPAPVAGVEVLPLLFDHGVSPVFGYRIGRLAYVTDVKRIPSASLDRLRGVEVLVMSALWWRDHPTHQSIPEAIQVAKEIGARRTYLTHLSHETPHAELLARLPAGIEPAWDGLTVEVAE
jgi:phosphoribosyl 1,2-cyclic phosphate phosphodiesterase